MSEIRDAYTRLLDSYEVEAGSLRDAIGLLIGVMEIGENGTEMAVASRLLGDVSTAIRDFYTQQSPLAEQLDYIRTRKFLAERGIEVPSWEEIAHKTEPN